MADLTNLIETEEELGDIMLCIARTATRDRASGVAMQRDGMFSAGQMYIDQANRLTTLANKLNQRLEHPKLDKVGQIEVQIISATVRVLLDAGYLLSVYDGEETTVKDSTDAAEINGAMRSTGEDHIFARKTKQTRAAVMVRFVYGNSGWDVINDYSTSLETVLKPVFALARTFEEDAG